jgi:small conductance mechanosensitive channel
MSISMPSQMTALLSADTLTLLGQIASSFVYNAVIAFAMVAAGIWASGWAARALSRALNKSERIDDTLIQFFASVVRYSILAFVGVAVLGRMGVETTSLVAVLGAATLAIGLALQGTLGNVAAGVMLILFRPYRIGDAVELAARQGVVKDLNIFTTELATVDNVKIIIPNGQVWGQTIVNYTGHAERRVDIPVRVALEDDPDKAVEEIKVVIAGEGRLLAAPEPPFVQVTDVTDTAFIVSVRVWVKGADVFPVRFALLRAIQKRLRASGFSVPYPATRTV